MTSNQWNDIVKIMRKQFLNKPTKNKKKKYNKGKSININSKGITIKF